MNNNSLTLGAGIGAYIINASEVNIKTRTYKNALNVWKPGEVDTDTSSFSYLDALLGGEFSAEYTLTLGEKIKLGIGGRLEIIGKKEVDEDTEKDFTSHTAVSESIYKIKKGMEIGGLGFSFGISLNFPF